MFVFIFNLRGISHDSVTKKDIKNSYKSLQKATCLKPVVFFIMIYVSDFKHL